MLIKSFLTYYISSFYHVVIFSFYELHDTGGGDGRISRTLQTMRSTVSDFQQDGFFLNDFSCSFIYHVLLFSFFVLLDHYTKNPFNLFHFSNLVLFSCFQSFSPRKGGSPVCNAHPLGLPRIKAWLPLSLSRRTPSPGSGRGWSWSESGSADLRAFRRPYPRFLRIYTSLSNAVFTTFFEDL